VRDWLTTHPWVMSAMTDPMATVFHVGPGRLAFLPGPTQDVPEDLIERLSSIQPDGRSASVVTQQLGLNPTSAFLLAAVGSRAGLWDLWPTWYDQQSWESDQGGFPTLNAPAQARMDEGQSPLLDRWEKENAEINAMQSDTV
jgi:hypothetical protein